jgi:protein SCO1/2
LNKKALYAVMLAALLPLTCYLIVKRYSEEAVAMPGHYFADSVITVTKKGKKVDDTVWHQLSPISLVNQLGDTVSLGDLHGKIIVADFFFTHCPSICPTMTANMRRIQQSVNNGERVGDRTNQQVHFVSFSIDPERDSVAQIKKWADRFQIDPDQWWLLTGEKKKIYDFAINEVKLGLMDGFGVDTAFLHSEKFVLIDTNFQVRGFYSGLDTMALAHLSRDMVLLTLEKDPKGRGGFLEGKLMLLAVVFLAAIIGVGLFLFLMQKNTKNVTRSLDKK